MRLPTAMRRSSRQGTMHFLRKQLELPNKHDRMFVELRELLRSGAIRRHHRMKRIERDP